MHTAVLQKEVLEYLNPKPNENFIDCTIGEGGHTLKILEKNGPAGKILGIDRDSRQIANCKLKIENYQNRVILVNDSYDNLKEIVGKNNFRPVQGILFDLGMSSWHLEESERGFSFLRDEILDMRYGTAGHKLTAVEIVNQWAEAGIEKILREYGEERFSKKIARQIIQDRKNKPIVTTTELVETIKRAVPDRFRYGKIHFATRTFQALRIAVNDELNNIKKTLPQAIEILAPEGRLVIISFHSLEDRIVKNFFKEVSLINLEIITKKPITPTKEELIINPRSRSAKLRAAIKT